MTSLPPIELHDYDPEIRDIVDYVISYKIASEEAWTTARYCLIDSLACHLLALTFPECRKLLGPYVNGSIVPGGARVPGTSFELDPVKAAFDIGCGIRWLDFNDTWLAAEWGHPSDNLGALLAVSDFVSRSRISRGEHPYTGRDLLEAMIKAYEIQGVLALENAFNRLGLDHVILVKIASSALASFLLGGSPRQIAATLSHAWLDGHSLRTYRHAPNTGPRKSWAAGDATSRAVWLALMVMRGEHGYPSVLSTPTWGAKDTLMRGRDISRSQEYRSYVMENVLFKISYPAEFHGQTAVECAIALHPSVRDRIDQVERIELTTQEPAVRIIAKEGPLTNPAARDHCLQYMVAIGLLYGDLKAEHYEDTVACNPAIDALRKKMKVKENAQYSADYYDPAKRSIANAVQIFFADGTHSNRIEIEYPVGHRRRRQEGAPLLFAKAERLFRTALPEDQAVNVLALLNHPEEFLAIPVPHLLSQLAFP